MFRSLVVAIAAVTCLQVVYLPTASAQPVSCPAGLSIDADPTFYPLFDVMFTAGETSQLCALSVSGTRLVWDDTLPDDVLGMFVPRQQTIYLRDDIGTTIDEAAVLTHESTHLLDRLEGRLDGSSEACYQTEIHAFTVEGLFWASLYTPTGKAYPANRFEDMLNLVAHDAVYDPGNIETNVRLMYQEQCG